MYEQYKDKHAHIKRLIIGVVTPPSLVASETTEWISVEFASGNRRWRNLVLVCTDQTKALL
jgi:hypothetical protein